MLSLTAQPIRCERCPGAAGNQRDREGYPLCDPCAAVVLPYEADRTPDYFTGGAFRIGHGRLIGVPELAAFALRYPLRRVGVRRLAACLRFGRTDEPVGSAAFRLRAFRADLAFPLLLLRTTRGLRIADGCHRTYRAMVEGRRCLPAYIVPVADLAQMEGGRTLSI
jgi:hypothetical protein